MSDRYDKCCHNERPSKCLTCANNTVSTLRDALNDLNKRIDNLLAGQHEDQLILNSEQYLLATKRLVASALLKVKDCYYE